ncbi:MAG: hypothetical protein ABIO99_03210 [Candidatus Limnocylindria bacterium]
MLFPPNPDVLDVLVRDRQTRLDASEVLRVAQVPAPWRLLLGHALISMGSRVSGERSERQAHRSPVPRSA